MLNKFERYEKWMFKFEFAMAIELHISWRLSTLTLSIIFMGADK